MQQVKAIALQFDNPKHKLLLLIGYGAGLRRSEIVTLKWADILFDEHKIHVKQTKGNKDRIVMLPYSIIVLLMDYRRLYPSDEWVFAGQYKGEALSGRTVQQVMKNAVTKAGLEKKATVHTLRHSCYSFVRKWHRYSLHTATVGAQQYKNHHDLHPHHAKSGKKDHQPVR